MKACALSLREDRFRTGYLQNKHDVYVELVRLQIELNLVEDAFTTAERLRAHSYAEQLEGRSLDALSKDGLQREQELRERIRQLQRAMDTERGSRDQRQVAIRTFSTELLAAEREYQEFIDDHLLATTGARTATDESGSMIIREKLANDELLIEYVVGRNEVMLFAVSKETLFADHRTRKTNRSKRPRRTAA